MSTTEPATKVADILPPQTDGTRYLDFAGNEIHCVYSYNPPYYAVYRTRVRVMIQYADADKDGGAKVVEQRAALRSLTALRGQVNSLIDGWHTAGDKPDDPGLAWRLCYYFSFGWLPCRDRWDEETRKRGMRYDRRMADAIVTALEGDTPTGYALLQEVKNDIVSERTSIARVKYLITAFSLAASGIVLVWLFAGLRAKGSLAEQLALGVTGGTVGAFFSIAIGLRGRTVLIDLQNRDNIADAVLRVLIGTMSGGILLCLLLSGIVQLPIGPGSKPSSQVNPDIVLLVLGFFAGFFERLVPNLLEKTNLGSQTAASAVPPAAGPSTKPDGARDNGPDKGAQPKQDGKKGAPPRAADPTAKDAAGAGGEQAENDGADANGGETGRVDAGPAAEGAAAQPKDPPETP